MSRARPVATIEPIALLRDLIRCASVTPADAGALDVLQRVLEPLGFVCHRLVFSAPDTPDVDNLYARLGERAPNFCFAGHTDVVPPGDRAAWKADPFAATVVDGRLYGRGATDMKGAIAAFAVATQRLRARHPGPLPGSISLLITGDEEGPSINGTKKVLEWLAAKGERLDACVVGEPTSARALGDMVKIGRRGSLNGKLTVRGVQGHVAYPHLADNPAHTILAMLSALVAEPLDRGTEHFSASSLQVTTIDVANPTTNLIPAVATAGFNIRFNDTHTGVGLTDWLRRTLDGVGKAYDLHVTVSGEAFLTPPGKLSETVSRAIARTCDRVPELSTSGGTSDARFIRFHCPVIEFGLVSETMHKVDENVPVADVEALSRIYEAVLEGYLFEG